MADYKLTAEQEPCIVIRTEDGAGIPPDMANRDYNGDAMSPGYIQWKEAGGVPDPYVAPPPPPPSVNDQQQTAVLYDHENRLRAAAGDPPLTLADFITKANHL